MLWNASTSPSQYYTKPGARALRVDTRPRARVVASPSAVRLVRTPPLLVAFLAACVLFVAAGFVFIGYLFLATPKGVHLLMPYAFGATLAFVAVGFVVIAIVNARQRRDQRARDSDLRAIYDRVRRREPLARPLFVYLRGFRSRSQRTATETLVIELFERFGALACIDEPDFVEGMGRLSADDATWQETVLELCEAATAVIVYPAPGDGTVWEVRQVVERGWHDRTFFFMPPNVVGPIRRGLLALGARGSDPAQRERVRSMIDVGATWERARERCRDVGLELPPYRDAGGLFSVSRTRSVEWIATFGREHLWGRPPEAAIAALAGRLEALRPPTGRREAGCEV